MFLSMLGPIEFSLQHHFKPDQSAFEELETYDRRGQDSNSISSQGGPEGKFFVMRRLTTGSTNPQLIGS